MSRGVNRVILLGHLGADPEVKYLPSGVAIATMSLATSEQWKDKQTGEKQERTEWHRIKFFGRLAEIAGEYLRKGSQVYVEGSLRTDKYTDKDGIERYTTNIICSELQMLGGGGGGAGRGAEADAERYAGRGGRAGGAPASRGGGGGGTAPPAGDSGISDDDLPFATCFGVF